MFSSQLATNWRKHSSRSLAFLSLSIAVLSIATTPILVRLSETELGANATSFNRLFLFVLMFGPSQLIAQAFSAASKNESTASPKATTLQQWLLLASLGVFGIGAMVLTAISLQHTTVAKCMLLGNLTPIFTSLGGWLFLSKRFDHRFLIGMGIALVGAIALGLDDLGGEGGLLVGDLCAIASAAFRGAYFLVVEQLRSRFSSKTILLWRCATGSLILLPLALLTEGQLFPTTITALLAVIGLGLVSEGLGHRLLANSMKQFSSSFVSLFMMLEPLVGALLAWLILTEPLGMNTWMGFAVVLTGIYWAKSGNAAQQTA